MDLNNSNYHSTEANRAFWSSSLFKAFDKCEASGLAQVRGEYQREETDALLIGSYVDAYFSNELDDFMKINGEKMFKKNGELLAKFAHANEIIDRVEADPLMMEFLKGDKQTIMTAELFDVPWKVKLDVFDGKRIVDLKCVKDFDEVFEKGFGYRSWIEAWGYDIQGAIYQKVVELNTGEKLPFYLAAVTKERVPDIKVIQIPQHILDAALNMVEAKIERFDMIKSGDVEPRRCEKCDYCKRTKILTAPEVYEIKEAE